MWYSILREVKMNRVNFFLGTFLSLLMMSGCTVIETLESYNGIFEPKPPDYEVALLKEAEVAYFAESYEEAESIYTQVFDLSKREVYRNAAVYGISCIRIIAAETPDDLKNSLSSLQKWTNIDFSRSLYWENPELLIKALQERKDDFECDPEIRYVVRKKYVENSEAHKKEIEELQETIKKLEHQISELEAIDQEIQEKRKPL